MKFQHLQAFVAAAHHRSLRAAARELGITQPAVTHTIRELETTLNAELMIRSVRGIELTACGLALLPRAEQLLGDMQRTVEAVEQVKGELAGKVSLGTTPSIALTMLPQAVSTFRHAMPLVSLHLEEVTLPEALAKLRNGTLDIATTHYVQALDADLVQTPLFSTQFVVAMRTGHPLANARRLHELLDSEWIVTVGTDDVPHSVVHAMFDAHGLPVPKRVLRAPSSFAVTLGLISQTDVIACFTRPLAAAVAPLGVRVVEIEEALPGYDISVLSRRDLLPTPAALQFVSCLQDAARERIGGLTR